MTIGNPYPATGGNKANAGNKECQSGGSDRFAWSLVVLLAAVFYLVVTLFGGIDSPLFGLAMLLLMARELFRSRRNRGTHGWRPPSRRLPAQSSQMGD
jgi:hypothetical protein